MERSRHDPNQRPLAVWPQASSGLGALVLATFVVLGGACGVRRNVLEQPDGSTPTSVSRWTSAVCTVSRTCCGPEQDALNALASCESQLDTTLDLSAGLAAGRLVLDAAILGQCEVAVKTASCGAAIPDLAPCRGALQGTVATGGECHSDHECARGPNGAPALCFKGVEVHGDEVLPGATGQCRPSPVAKLGEPCSLTVDYDFAQPQLSGDLASAAATYPRCSRASGLVCGPSSTCVAAPGVGDPCREFFDECGGGLACACGLCEVNEALRAATSPFCVDGACTLACPQPVAAGDAAFCIDAVDPSDGKCHVPSLYCGYTADCPPSWAVAQSPGSCNGGADTIVLGACGDTRSWHRPTFKVTCYYDDASGRLVGVMNETESADQFCYGASPAQLQLFAGHVPPNCPGDAGGTVRDCSQLSGCDGGAPP